MRLRLRTIVPMLVTLTCVACATVPELTPAQLGAKRLAAIHVASTRLWKIAAPAGQGYGMDITSVNGKSVCSPARCPSYITVPAGRADIGLLCSLLVDNLRLPKQATIYTGDFVAGHVYEIRPVSVVPGCKVEVRDVMSQVQ